MIVPILSLPLLLFHVEHSGGSRRGVGAGGGFGDVPGGFGHGGIVLAHRGLGIAGQQPGDHGAVSEAPRADPRAADTAEQRAWWSQKYGAG